LGTKEERGKSESESGGKEEEEEGGKTKLVAKLFY